METPIDESSPIASHDARRRLRGERLGLSARLGRLVDVVLVILLVVGFAAFVTLHVALSGVLFFLEKPRWKGLVALVVPPLAPLWGFRAGRTRVSIAWLSVLGMYVIARVVASFG